jgi:hypothetical protein
MSAKQWTAVAGFCPGVGKGPLIPRERIEAVLKEQRESTAQL